MMPRERVLIKRNGISRLKSILSPGLGEDGDYRSEHSTALDAWMDVVSKTGT